MSRLRLTLAPYAARLIRPLVTARGPITVREGWWVVAHDSAGRVGLGEVSPLPDWGTESAATAAATLAALDGREMARPARERLDEWLSGLGLSLARTPAAYAGLELALIDLMARREGCSLAEWLAPDPARAVPLNALLSGETPASAAESARQARAAGYAAYKLKIGALPLATDVARALAVREAIGPAAELRLDANGGWGREEAAAALRALAPADPAYVEQPVAADDPEGLAWVEATSGVAVAADEAIGGPGQAEVLVALSGLSALVIKPMALGGVRTALTLARAARAAGKRVVLTSALDRGVGSAGVLHLACALGGKDAAGLATSGLFAEGPALAGLTPVEGRLALPDGPGLGVSPQDATLARLAALEGPR